MNIDWIKDLERLAKTGNFSQAAKLSNLSQPAFSRRIVAIESWVGAKLVDRSKQPVSLTSAGSQFLGTAMQAVLRIENERSLILEANALPDKYIVTFGAQHSISWRFFPEWMQQFETSYGPVMTRLRADDLPACIDDLYNSSIDFVMAYTLKGTQDPTQIPDSRLKKPLESLFIGSDNLVPVCKKNVDGSPLFRLGDRRIKIPYLKFSETSSISRLITPTIERYNLRNMLATVYDNSMAGALRIRARDGIGIAWLPESLVKPDLEAGLLTVTGHKNWIIKLDVRLFRSSTNTNYITRSIWTFLSKREQFPLIQITLRPT